MEINNDKPSTARNDDGGSQCEASKASSKENSRSATATKTADDQSKRKLQEVRRAIKERDQLLNIQEQKRRRREDTAAQGRRSKELKDGKTPLKQKVERLRKERRAVIDEYDDTGGSMKRKKKKKRKHNIPLPPP